MKNIIILLTILVFMYTNNIFTARQPKKNSVIRIKKDQVPNNNIINTNVNTSQNNKNNNKINTIPGFSSMQLLNPEFLNQSTPQHSLQNNSIQSSSNQSNMIYPNNNNSTVNGAPISINTSGYSREYNHHIVQGDVMTLDKQMNTIYKQNKQNEIPQGSAYEHYQIQNNHTPHYVGIPQQAVIQNNSLKDQSILPINNNQGSLIGDYSNSQNLSANDLGNNYNMQNENFQYYNY